ncbi:MAG: radical SAM/SPASM domain-containing protein [Candidatus Hodarchaeota archaeon]
MRLFSRIVRYARISLKTRPLWGIYRPPILVLFLNSICNLRCEHCCYWRKLNRKDDLSVEEILSLARELGRLEILAISGGEPFLREGFSDICRCYIENNQLGEIYVPTNAYFTERIVKAVGEVLKDSSLKLFVVEISLDGMIEFHNRFRGSNHSFQKAMDTYDALKELQKHDSRLRIHAVSTVSAANVNDVYELTGFLYDRCPAIDHHNIALIRGDRKNPSLQGPDLLKYQNLINYTAQLWAFREKGRRGSSVEPMLQRAKVQTAEEQRQIVPCRAGVLSCVVYANGDVSVCETHPPLGNLRQKSFTDIWLSEKAQALRRSIHNKECYCTNEIFLWPSITFQPWQLAKYMWQAKVWKNPKPLKQEEKLKVLPIKEAI